MYTLEDFLDIQQTIAIAPYAQHRTPPPIILEYLELVSEDTNPVSKMTVFDVTVAFSLYEADIKRKEKQEAFQLGLAIFILLMSVIILLVAVTYSV